MGGNHKFGSPFWGAITNSVRPNGGQSPILVTLVEGHHKFRLPDGEKLQIHVAPIGGNHRSRSS